MANKLTFDDFLKALRRMRGLGLFREFQAHTHPYMPHNPADIHVGNDIKQVEAAIESMTIEERRCLVEITESRRRRIAAGSGNTDADVRGFLNQFVGIQRVCEQLGGA